MPIIEDFIDVETWQRVVHETRLGDPRVYETVFDRETGRPLAVEERITALGGPETRDDGRRRVTIVRRIDPLTGFETLEEHVHGSQTGKLLRTSQRAAHRSPRMHALDRDSQRAGRRNARERARFVRDEYPAMSHDERVRYWAGHVSLAMRMEHPDDSPYAVFDVRFHAALRRTDPAIDTLFDEIARRVGVEPARARALLHHRRGTKAWQRALAAAEAPAAE